MPRNKIAHCSSLLSHKKFYFLDASIELNPFHVKVAKVDSQKSTNKNSLLLGRVLITKASDVIRVLLSKILGIYSPAGVRFSTATGHINRFYSYDEMECFLESYV